MYELWDARSEGVVLQFSWNRTMAEYARVIRTSRRIGQTNSLRAAGGFRCVVRKLTIKTRAKASSIATRKARSRSSRILRRSCPNSSAVRRICRLQPDRMVRLVRSDGVERRQLSALRRARIRDGRHHERPCAARRIHSVRRHIPRVLGLLSQRLAPSSAHARASAVRLHSRLHRSG